MGFKTAAIITTCCFMLGVLLSGLGNADWPLLYSSDWNKDDLDRAERYYLTLYMAPGAVSALLHGMVAVCVLALCAKVAKWQETNLFFDGSSLALVVAAIALYASVTIPNLRILARQPIIEQQLAFGGRLRRWLNREMVPEEIAREIPPPLDDRLRFEILSLTCASNNLIIALLVGVVLFQAAQTYAHWTYERELKKMNAEGSQRKDQ